MTLVGQHIGRYRILEQLGQGGMSVVYKGLDTALDREVAVKVLHPHLANRPESRKRLEREAKAVARLHHPNILEVFDYAGEAADEAFIVTEYIRGRTLRQVISDDSLQPPEVAAMVVHELASALAHAHDNSVLHRDLKPENVMVRDDGVIKLMDFGIAKIVDRDERMTMTGALVGSPAHMAPEIIEGDEAGPEADVFSLGTMLYLFVTGALPFNAPNTTATLKRILDAVFEDPRKLVPTVSDELAEIIATCLARAPGSRFASAAALRDALADALSPLGLLRPGDELKEFFRDPLAYRKHLMPRITRALLDQAQALISEKKSARALAALNQVLAHDSSNAQALALLGHLQTRRAQKQRARQRRRWALVAGVLLSLTLVAWQGVRVATAAPDFHLPIEFDPLDVELAQVRWPPPPAIAPPNPAPAETVPAAAPRPPPATAPAPAPARPGSNAVEVAVIVRPFGYLQVDDGPRSADALSRHRLQLPAGPHRFAVTCDGLCEVDAPPVIREVRAGEDIALIAPLKASLVSFSGYPDGAVARIGAQEKPAADSLAQPFRLLTPKEGSQELRHHFKFEVRLGDQVIDRGTRTADPGKALLVVRGKP